MSTLDPTQLRRSRIQLLMIFALFLIPPVSAWVAWQYFADHGVVSTTNAGTLVSPARPLELAGLAQGDGSAYAEQQLRGRWTYVLFSKGDCDERCRQQLYLTRQTRMSMNKDIRRIQRLLILDRPPSAELAKVLSEEHADLAWVVKGAGAGGLLQRFQGPGFGTSGQQYFLVDPLGNLMMYYGNDVAARGMLKDLQKLLKISQIG